MFSPKDLFRRSPFLGGFKTLEVIGRIQMPLFQHLRFPWLDGPRGASEPQADQSSSQPPKTILEKLAPMSSAERLERKDQDLLRVAQHLLQRHSRGKYANTKVANLVVEMLFRAETRMLRLTFGEEKRSLRRIVQRAHEKLVPVYGKRKNEGQLPTPVTFNKVIKSLEPIYQEILMAMRS